MITKITPVDALKQIFLEILLNKTDKVSDISNESVLNGFAYGVGKLTQRLLTTQAVIEGHIFPDTAYGTYLDAVATLRGVAGRFGATGSHTYLRVTGDEGTAYLAGVHTFTASSGITFEIESSVSIGANGFAYVPVKSVQTGANTNVEPLSITRVSPTPTGHVSVVNEYAATGGADAESDALFRERIKMSVAQLSRTTMSYLEQVFMAINPRVLRLCKGAYNDKGQYILIVVPVNGADFTEDEFNELLNRSADYLTLSQLYRSDGDYALELQNVNWFPVDIEFRVDIDPAVDVDEVRKNIQIEVNKLFDYRWWSWSSDVIEWENILHVARNAEGVRYVPDNHFTPGADIRVPEYRLPRVRGFIMRDLDGNILEDNGGVLNDVYYPNEPDAAYRASVLATI